ncbi:MAG: ATP synthase F1 subunit delta [Bacillota bacterium]|nr:ATP synthase F1 subunit delta [Bacillota bacterium]
MINRKVAKRYAKALGELAAARQALDIVQRDLERVVSAIRSDATVSALVASRNVSRAAKEELLLKLAGDDAADLTKHFLRLVVQKRREDHLPAMFEAFVAYADRVRGVVEVEVTTAVPLGDEEAKRLAESLVAFTGNQVRLVPVVEPKILGGVVARVGDVVVDGSVATRLKRLKETLQRTRLQHVG